MIRLDSVIEQMGTDPETGKRILKVSLEADTAAEVVAIGTDPATVKGMPQNTIIGAFSDCFTAEKELLILNSSGVWQ